MDLGSHHLRLRGQEGTVVALGADGHDHQISVILLDILLVGHLGSQRVFDVLGDDGRPGAVGIGHSLGAVVRHHHMAVLDAQHPGAVHQLTAVGLEVVDQMAAVGGAGAFLEVLQHLQAGDLAQLLGGQPERGLQTHGAAADDDDLLVGICQFLGMGQQVDGVNMTDGVQTGNGRHALAAAVSEHHGVVIALLQQRVIHGGVQVNGNALGLAHLRHQPIHVVLQLILAQGRACGVHLAAHLVGLLKDLHRVAAMCGGDGKVQTGAACAHNGDLLDLLGPGGDGGQHILKAGAGIDGALGMAALHELVDAGLLTADAGTDLLHLTGVGLVAPVGIGQHGTAQHDHVCLAVTQRLLGDVGIAQFTDGHDRHFHAHVGLDAAGGKILLGHLADVQEAACGHACGRMRQPPVIIAAQVNVEHIDAGFHQILHVVQGIGDGAAVLEVLQGLDGVHALAVGLLQRQAQVDTVHDGIIGAYALADGLDQLNAEALPVGVLADLAAVEGGAGQLIQQIALVAVQVHTVQTHGLGIDGGLTGILDDAVALEIRQGTAGHVRQIEVGVHGGGHRELELGQQALGIAHAAQAGGQLDEDAAAAGVDTLGQIAPAHEVGAGAVDTGEVGIVALFGNGGVDVVADGDQAGGQQADAALGTGEEVLQHLVIGTAALLGHLTVAHGRHDEAVLHRQLIDLNGGKQGGIRIILLGHPRRTALTILTVGTNPVSVAVDQLLN